MSARRGAEPYKSYLHERNHMLRPQQTPPWDDGLGKPAYRSLTPARQSRSLTPRRRRARQASRSSTPRRRQARQDRHRQAEIHRWKWRNRINHRVLSVIIGFQDSQRQLQEQIMKLTMDNNQQYVGIWWKKWCGHHLGGRLRSLRATLVDRRVSFRMEDP